MNKFQKNFVQPKLNVVILLFVYAVNFNIFNELFDLYPLVLSQLNYKTKIVEMLDSN